MFFPVLGQETSRPHTPKNTGSYQYYKYDEKGIHGQKSEVRTPFFSGPKSNFSAVYMGFVKLILNNHVSSTNHKK